MTSEYDSDFFLGLTYRRSWPSIAFLFFSFLVRYTSCYSLSPSLPFLIFFTLLTSTADVPWLLINIAIKETWQVELHLISINCLIIAIKCHYPLYSTSKLTAIGLTGVDSAAIRLAGEVWELRTCVLVVPAIPLWGTGLDRSATGVDSVRWTSWATSYVWPVCMPIYSTRWSIGDT